MLERDFVGWKKCMCMNCLTHACDTTLTWAMSHQYRGSILMGSSVGWADATFFTPDKTSCFFLVDVVKETKWLLLPISCFFAIKFHNKKIIVILSLKYTLSTWIHLFYHVIKHHQHDSFALGFHCSGDMRLSHEKRIIIICLNIIWAFNSSSLPCN